MLYKFDVTNWRGQTLTLNMEEDEGGIQVAEVEGLDPVKAALTSSNSVLDGEEFQHAKRGPRNIVIKADLEPDFDTETYFSLRRKLYKHFPTKSQVDLRFYLTTGLSLDIKGIVEEISAPSFEQDPTVQISLMCFQPDFLDPRVLTISGNTVSDNTNTVIDYPGDIEVGVVLVLNPERPVDAITMYNTNEGGRLDQLDFTLDLEAGDQLVISSLAGAKGVTLTRDGVSSSVLYGRSSQSSWIQLFEGLNEFRVYATGDPIPYELEYVVRYGGI